MKMSRVETEIISAKKEEGTNVESGKYCSAHSRGQ